MLPLLYSYAFLLGIYFAVGQNLILYPIMFAKCYLTEIFLAVQDSFLQAIYTAEQLIFCQLFSCKYGIHTYIYIYVFLTFQFKFAMTTYNCRPRFMTSTAQLMIAGGMICVEVILPPSFDIYDLS